MVSPADISNATDYAEARLDLSALPTDYGYHSLPLCLIDAVYSINAHYSGVQKVVARYCAHASITDNWPDHQRPAPRAVQHPVSALLAHMRALGPEAFTQTVFRNVQRTSTKSGILKGEAVYQFAEALEHEDMEYVQDLPAVMEGSHLEDAILRIPGQNSGVSLRYFQMLAGDDDFIKPDRMILRFLADALHRPVPVREATPLLRAASDRLRTQYPLLTPRLLDNRIWQYQRVR